MRALAILAIAAVTATAPAMADSIGGVGRTVPTTGDWSSVPTIALRPPAAATAPNGQMGNWSSSGWRSGGTGWQADRPKAGNPAPNGTHRQWRSWRGSWRGAPARAHFHPRPGIYMPGFFLAPSFLVSNWWNYGLPEPGFGQRWVRYYDDAVLIDGRGYILDTASDVEWANPDLGEEAYYRYEAQPGWARDPYPAYAYHPPVYYVPTGVTRIIVQAPPTVTTTTTTYVEEVPVRARRTWKPKPRCACK